MSPLNETIESSAVVCTDDPFNKPADIALTLDVLLIFMSGVAIIVGLIFLVYVVVILFDRYCGCGGCETGWIEEEIYPENYQNEALEGPSAEAGLWSLSTEERRSVLKQVFVGCTTHYCTSRCPHALQSTCSNDNAKLDPEGRERSTSCSSSGLNGRASRDSTMVDESCFTTTSCAVCLEVFQEGDSLLHGRNCRHIFHYHCVLLWMEQNHDHCPYCREEMMATQDMRRAALKVLDRQRLKELGACRCP